MNSLDKSVYKMRTHVRAIIYQIQSRSILKGSFYNISNKLILYPITLTRECFDNFSAEKM